MKIFQNFSLLGYIIFLSCQSQSDNSGSEDSQVEINFEEEKKAIIKVIESESAAFWNKNYNEWSSYWVQESYIRTMGWWEAGGVTVVEGWNERAKRMKEHMEESPEPNPTASNVNRVNINIRIFEDVAWLTFDQYGEDTGDTLMDMPGLSRETRILEKHDGQWKIAYVGWLLQGSNQTE